MSISETATVTSHSYYSSGDTIDDFKPKDSRRYGTLLPAQIAKGLSIVYLDEDEDDNGTYTDFQSSWEFSPPSLASAGFFQTSQTQQLNTEDETLANGKTESQQIAEDYRRKGSVDADVIHSLNSIGEGREVEKRADPDLLNTAKDLPPVPGDRDSIYTLAISDDGQSIIDIEKRPEPTIRLFYNDQGGLAHAQHQGMEMIQAGLSTPGGMIRCQRPGCTDILRDLEALKFHLHIHNIGDMSDGRSTLSVRSRRTPKNLRHLRLEFQPVRKSGRKFHNRSKSSVETDATSRYSQSTYQTRVKTSLPCSRKPSTTDVNSGALRDKTPDTYSAGDGWWVHRQRNF